VDIGFKEVGGEPTDHWRSGFWFQEKKPLEEVPGEERIPDEIEGHPSDVIQRRFELHSTGAYAAVHEVLPRWTPERTARCAWRERRPVSRHRGFRARGHAGGDRGGQRVPGVTSR